MKDDLYISIPDNVKNEVYKIAKNVGNMKHIDAIAILSDSDDDPKNKVVNRIINGISKLLDKELLHTGYAVCTKDSNGEVSRLSYFLALVIFTAFFNGFDNDKSLANAYSINGENNADGKIPLEFGFNNMCKALSAVLESEGMDAGTEAMDRARATSNLLSNLRDNTSADEYISQKLYEKDIKVIEFLLKTPDESYNTDTWNLLENAIVLVKNHIDNNINEIKKVYMAAFSQTFGLKRFWGVLGNDEMMHALNVTNGSIIEPYSANGINPKSSVKYDHYFADAYNTVEGQLGIITSNSRQFDIKQILESDKPVYFPRKMLEPVCGFRITKRVSTNQYSYYDGPKDYNAYFDAQAKPFFEDTLKSVACNIANDYISETDTPLEKSKSILRNKDAIVARCTEAFKKLKNSFCIAIAVTEFKKSGDAPTKICIKVVDITGHSINDTEKETEMFFARSANAGVAHGSTKIDFKNPIVTNIEDSNMRTVEVKHEFNPKLADMEPLFMYKAVRLYKEQSKKVDWNSVLFGEDLNGNIVQAGAQITIGKSVVHNIYAGSRCGKGLLTMTLIASALANGKALFYLDRKPDMASMFAEISQNNMFVVNGGQYDTEADTFNRFLEGNANCVNAAMYYNKAKAEMPDYVKKVLRNTEFSFSTVGSSNDINDFAYFRAMILCLGIELARIQTYSGQSDIYERLGGEDGVIFVFDETSNWFLNFEKAMLSYNTGFFKSELLMDRDRDKNEELERLEGELDGYKSSLKASNKKILSLNAKIEVETEEKAIKKAQTDLRVEEKVLADTERKIKELEPRVKELKKNPAKAYSKQLFQKLSDTYAAYATYRQAGLHDTPEESRVDIFMIGQSFGACKPIKYDTDNNSGEFFKLNKQGDIAKTMGGDGSFIRTLINTLPNDWFFGGNLAEVKNSMTDIEKEYITEARKWWMYKISDSVRNPIDACSKLETKQMFKPYIVLNAADEERVMYSSDSAVKNKKAKYIDGVSRGVIVNAGAKPEEWLAIRRNLVAQEYENMSSDAMDKTPGILDPGIGFEGLIGDVSETTGQRVDNEALVNILSKSRAIADFAVQQCGYSCYEEFIYDFSPEGICSVTDIANAITGKSRFDDYATRLPIIAAMGEFTSPEANGIGDASGDDAFDEINEPNDGEFREFGAPTSNPMPEYDADDDEDEPEYDASDDEDEYSADDDEYGAGDEDEDEENEGYSGSTEDDTHSSNAGAAQLFKHTMTSHQLQAWLSGALPDRHWAKNIICNGATIEAYIHQKLELNYVAHANFDFDDYSNDASKRGVVTALILYRSLVLAESALGNTEVSDRILSMLKEVVANPVQDGNQAGIKRQNQAKIAIGLIETYRLNIDNPKLAPHDTIVDQQSVQDMLRLFIRVYTDKAAEYAYEASRAPERLPRGVEDFNYKDSSNTGDYRMVPDEDVAIDQPFYKDTYGTTFMDPRPTQDSMKMQPGTYTIPKVSRSKPFYKFRRKLFESGNGTSYVFKCIFDEILKSIDTVAGDKSMVTKLEFSNNQVRVNGGNSKLIILNNILSNDEYCVELEDVFDFDKLFKRYISLKDLRIPYELLDIIMMEYGFDQKEMMGRFFELSSKLMRITLIQPDGRQVTFTRASVTGGKTSNVLNREMKEREARMKIDQFADSNNPRLHKKSPGRLSRFVKSSRAIAKQTGNGGIGQVIDKHPRVAAAGAVSVAAIGIMTLGAPVMIGGLALLEVKNLIGRFKKK